MNFIAVTGGHNLSTLCYINWYYQDRLIYHFVRGHYQLVLFTIWILAEKFLSMKDVGLCDMLYRR